MPKNEAVNSRNQYRPFWEGMYLESRERLIAYALRLSNGNVYDAEDLLQDTFCRILLYTKDPQEIRSPLGYLLTIMRNIWRARRRKEGTVNMISIDEAPSKKGRQNVEPAVEPDALRILEDDERKATVRANLGPLSPREELLLELLLRDYTRAEIADMLGEDVRLICADVNALRTKIVARIKKASALK